MKNKLVVLAGVVIVAAVVAVVQVRNQGTESSRAEEESTPVLSSKRIAEARPAVSRKPVAVKRVDVSEESDDDSMSEADRRLSDAIQAALDDDDFAATRSAAQKALKSACAEVRQEAVDALGWFGDKALVELTRAMGDKDPEIAESARGHVEDALMGMDDDVRAFALATEYIKLFAEDEDAAAMFAGVMSSAGNMIIDPEDSDSAEDVAKAKSNRAAIVDTVSEMIESGGKLAEHGRELYEEISGEEWTGKADAEKWIAEVDEE